MKRILRKYAIMIGITIIGTGSSFAQKSGVFKTFTDYSTGKMEYGIDCAFEKHKIKLNDFFRKDFITVVHDGKPYNLKKAEIWGFQLCDEKIIRFQGKEDFQVSDIGLLWIYLKQKKVSRHDKTNVSKTITTFYFSKEGDDAIWELTPGNLKAAFPDSHKLHDAIDAQFNSEALLSEYDQFHKHYKINHFLEIQGIK